MFKRKKNEDDPLIQLKTAQRLELIEESEPEPLSEISMWRYWNLKWDNRVPHKITYVLQSVGVAVLVFIGSTLILNAVFGKAYAAAGAEPTATHTPPPALPTRTSIPTATPSITPLPTPAPQGKGKAMADIFTSSHEGFDPRFGTNLMGNKPDYEEYLLCFDGTGMRRDGFGNITEGTWGTWSDQSGFCMPGIFDSVSKVNNILITSDVVHAIGLTEVEWIGISVHIYEYGAPDDYAIFCPPGVIAQTSKYCLGRQ